MVHAGLAPQWDLAKALQLGKEVEAVLRGNQGEAFFAAMFGNQPNAWDDKLTTWDRIRCIVNYMTRMRFCTSEGELNLDAKGTPANAPTGTMPWFQVANRQTAEIDIVFGHWAALQGQTNWPQVFALDYGCVWGNQLAALRLEDQKKFKDHKFWIN